MIPITEPFRLSWQAFDFRLALTNILDSLVQVSGAKLESYSIQHRLLATWLAHSGNSGKVIEGASALASLVGEEDCRRLKGCACDTLTQAYAQLGDFERSGMWATKAATAWGEAFPIETAQANQALIQSRIMAFRCGQPVSVESIITFAESEIKVDLRNERLGPALDKMDLILSQIFVPGRDARCQPWMDRMEQIARKLSQGTTEEGDIRTAAVLQRCGQALLINGQSERGIDQEARGVDHLEAAVKLFVKHQRLLQAASARQMQALALFSIFQKQPAVGTIQHCVKLISMAKDAFRAVEHTQSITESTYWHARYLYHAWLRRWTTGSAALEALREAEESWADQRRDMSVFATLEAVSRRQQLHSARKPRDIYEMAFHICQREGKMHDIWHWVQRAKARSLSDQLGIGMLIPATIREQIIGEPKLWDLVKQEDELTRQIAASETAARLRLRGELHALHRRMAEQPLLSTVLDLRRGNPVTLPQVLHLELQPVGESRQTGIAFVDWVDINGDIWIMVLRKDGVPKWADCGLRAATGCGLEKAVAGGNAEWEFSF